MENNTYRNTLTVDGIECNTLSEVSLCYRSDGDFESRLKHTVKALPIGTPSSMGVIPGSEESNVMLSKGVCAGGLFFYFEQVAGLREFDEETISVVWQREQDGITPVDVLEVKGCALPSREDALTTLMIEVLAEQIAQRVRELDLLRAGALMVLDDLLSNDDDATTQTHGANEG